MSTALERARHQTLANLLGISLQELMGEEEPKNPNLSRSGVKHKHRNPENYALYDWEMIGKAYDETDQTVVAISQLAKRFECQIETIYRALDRTGRSYPARKAGAPRRDVCQRGHDMTIHARPIKKGGRYCVQCKRERERKS